MRDGEGKGKLEQGNQGTAPTMAKSTPCEAPRDPCE